MEMSGAVSSATSGMRNRKIFSAPIRRLASLRDFFQTLNVCMSAATDNVEWILREPDPALLAALSNSEPGASLHPLTRCLLALRGVEDVEDFLEPRLASLSDPFELPQLETAARRILQAVDKKERVILFGDYDVDGITSIAQLTLALRAYGLEPGMFLPHRMDEGYGLSRDGLARCFEELGKPDLLVALDCGTSSVAEAAWLREQGVDCVIVDHHEPGASLPECVALLNPKLTDAKTVYCTAGLVFKLLHGLQKLRRLPDFDLREQLDLAALGTVADLVPLRGENRLLVRKGLEKIADTKRPGLRALKAIAGVTGFIESHHIGYRLGPRLNASGRLDHAKASLDLLLSEEAEEAGEIAALLDGLNRERQDVESRAQIEATEMINADPALAEAACIVLGSSSWHPGVVGIVASRIMRDFHRPALMLAFDENGQGRGSGRSVPGVSLVDALNECRHLLLKGGGHAMAVGVSIEYKNLAAFQTGMARAVEQQMSADQFRARLEVDTECRLSDLQESFLNEFTQIGPFGMGNPEPVFLIRNVEPRLPGQVLKDKHWKLMLQQGGMMLSAIWFNAPIGKAPPTPWDVVVKLQRQFWRGRESWSLLISDARQAQ